MNFFEKTADNERIFSIRGDFSVGDKDLFFEVFKKIRVMTEQRLVIDLTDCPSVDAAAMGMLVIAAQEAAKRNASRLLRGANSVVAKKLRSADFEKIYYFQ